MKLVANKAERRAHRDWIDAGGKGAGRIDWKGRDLSGAQDSGVPLRRARLVDCDFHRTSLRLSTLSEVYVEGSNFDAAQLVGDNAEQSHWIRTTFREADLGGTRFTNGTFERCDFSRAYLNRTTLSRGALVDCTFGAARVVDTRLDDARFERCDFRGALFGAKWLDGKDAHAIGATFVDCDFRGATFDRYQLSRCRFERCRFYDVSGPARIGEPSVAITCDLSEAGDGSRPVDWAQLVDRLLAPRS